MKRTLQAMLIALVAIMMPIGAWAQETTVEAKWGASATSPTHEGTLAEAIKAAVVDYDRGDYTASDVAYLQLQSSVTTTDDLLILGGTFTLDLNGHTLTRDGYTLDIRNEGTSVTLTDNSEDGTGKVVNTVTGAAPVLLDDGAHVTIEGGSYESASMAVLIQSGSSATISGGNFTSGNDYHVIHNNGELLSISGGTFGGEGIQSSVYAMSGSTTITGGTFAEGSLGTFEYYGGKLDLTGYPTTETEGTTPLTEICVYNGYASIAVDATILALPTGYCFYNSSEEAVVMLEEYEKYTIGTEPDTKYSITFAPDGGSGEMTDGISYGYGGYVLPECAFTAPEGKMFKAWLVMDVWHINGKEYQPGEAITVTENTTVTAVWRDYVPQIILELTDGYGDGWNDAAITVKKDGEEIGVVTIESGNAAAFRYDYDSTCEYTFYWTEGLYDYECSFVIKVEDETVLTASVDDCDGYGDGDLIHTIEAVPPVIIADGELTEYSNDEETNVGTLTYTRTLPNLKWNPLYVPFDIPVSILTDNYDVARISRVYTTTDAEGTVDNMEIEKLTEGTLEGNTPYFIRAKDEAAREMVLTIENATLKATATESVSYSSDAATYTLIPVYTAMTRENEDTDIRVITADGVWAKMRVGSTLKPFRFYLTITPTGSAASAPAWVRIVTRGETTEIENSKLKIENEASGVVYDLQGRRVAHPTKGVYIVNGRKVVY